MTLSADLTNRKAALERLYEALRAMQPSLAEDERETLDGLGEQLSRFETARGQEQEASEITLRHLAFVHHVLGTPYDFRKAFADNEIPAGPAPGKADPAPLRWKLLGFDIGYPLGVPASALTAKATWIDYFSRFGFNVFTFKPGSCVSWL